MAYKNEEEIEYRTLAYDELSRALFAGFCRQQVVTRCWRKVDGAWAIVSDPFTDDWDETEYAALIASLQNILKSGGAVYGAFSRGVLKGFSAVSAERLGKRAQYLDLVYLHVSKEQRGRGMGRALLRLSAQWARANGAEKLYLSAHSSVESQAFYRAMGCVEAEEYQASHVKSEPWDCQMELCLKD